MAADNCRRCGSAKFAWTLGGAGALVIHLLPQGAIGRALHSDFLIPSSAAGRASSPHVRPVLIVPSPWMLGSRFLNCSLALSLGNTGAYRQQQQAGEQARGQSNFWISFPFLRIATLCGSAVYHL